MSEIVERAVRFVRDTLSKRRTVGDDEVLFDRLASAIEALDRRIDDIAKPHKVKL